MVARLPTHFLLLRAFRAEVPAAGAGRAFPLHGVVRDTGRDWRAFGIRHAHDSLRHTIGLLLEAIIRSADAEPGLDDRMRERGREPSNAAARDARRSGWTAGSGAYGFAAARISLRKGAQTASGFDGAIWINTMARTVHLNHLVSSNEPLNWNPETRRTFSSRSDT